MNKKSPNRMRMAIRGLLILMALNLLLLAYITFPLYKDWLPFEIEGISTTDTPEVNVERLSPTATADLTATPTVTSTLPPASDTSKVAAVEKQTTFAAGLNQGVMVLALTESGYSHLFAYAPESLPFTRLTEGNWDDVSPAASPDGTRVAFSSHKNGFWDLYILDLASGVTTQVTDTPEYDGAPCWSPDGLWLAYETYNTDNLDVSILSLADQQRQIVTLTNTPGADYAPAWSPNGRQIAFVSTRSGESEIWVADLDRVDNRYFNVSRSAHTSDDHPAWSTDGNTLAWASNSDGVNTVMLLDVRNPTQPARPLGNGDMPVWSPGSDLVAVRIQEANDAYLSAYEPGDRLLTLPPQILPGALNGFTWSSGQIPQPLPGNLQTAKEITPLPLWIAQVTPLPDNPQNRLGLVNLPGVQAPNHMLQDEADEAFNALRLRTGIELGWDFLATLDNAFVPLTEPMPPSMGDDWLYTGRAVAINSVPASAGWMVVTREDAGAGTFWRVYVRARLQDGSQGMPLRQQPWDFNARYSGKPQIYEQGGALSQDIPTGYWVDFTDLALRYGWERLPALINWRTFFPAARFNEFVMANGLDWRAAILQIYPPEVLITPTPIVPPTITPSPTSTPAFSIAPTETFPAPPSFIVVGTPTDTPAPTATMIQINTAAPSQETIVPGNPVPQVVTPTPSLDVSATP